MSTAIQLKSSVAAERKRRTLRWLVVLLVIGVLAFLGWAWFAPLPYDEGFFIERRRAVEHFTMPDENAYWDYVDFPAITGADDWNWNGPFGHTLKNGLLTVSPDEVATAKDLLARNQPAQQRWQAALEKPMAVSQIQFDDCTAIATMPVFKNVMDCLKVRLIATIDSPAEFARTIHDAAHAVRTLSHDGTLVGGAVAVVMVDYVRLATQTHLALDECEFAPAEFAALDAALADLRTALGSIEKLVVNELVWNQQTENQAIAQLPPLQKLWVGLSGHISRGNRHTIEFIEDLESLAQTPNAEFHEFHQPSAGDYTARLGAWERFRMAFFRPIALPKFLGLAEEARQSQTSMFLLQWACRIEVYRARTGELPANLAAAANELADNARISFADDWEADGTEYRYEIFDLVGPNDEPRRGYYLASTGGFAWMGIENAQQYWPKIIIEIRPGNFMR